MNKEKRINLCKQFQEGDIVEGKVTRIEPYGAFVELECGLTGLVHIIDLSVARIRSPKERVHVGQNIKTMVKCINTDEGKISLSYKACLGTWDENANQFQQGSKCVGIIKETAQNNDGIFIELTPNLVGMSEYVPGFEYGDKVDVYIKKIDHIKKKVKLVIL